MADQQVYDAEYEWGITSGLPLADANVEITAMEFGFNNDISPGAVFANITFTNLEDGEEVEQSFSVGSGWEFADKGQVLVAANGKPKKISRNSNYGRLIESAVESIGGSEKAQELGKGFRFVDTLLGTQWHTTTVEVEVTRPGETEKIKRDRIVFDQFLGRSGAKPEAKADKKAEPEIDPELWERLVAEAGKHSSHDDFMDVVLEWEGVQGVKTVEKAVMSTRAGSVWATAHG